MKILIIKKFLISLILLSGCFCYAEVYKWTDAEGKVHYSNQKPDKQPGAQDVTHDIKKINADQSQAEQNKMQTIFRKENDADRAYRQQQAEAEPQSEHDKSCEKAKQLLKKMEGRVAFLTEDGKDMGLTEAQRRTRAEELRNQINENCNQ